MKNLLLAIITCASAITLTAAPSKTSVPKAPADVVLERDIQYRERHPRWVLNVISPKKKGYRRRAAIILVHGGGWATGDHYRYVKLGFTLAQRGYVVITPTYRLYHDAPFPACLHDMKNAIRWVRANADKYRIHPDRIGAYGNSAGGTIALTAAITNGRKDLEGDGSHLDFSSDLQAIVASGAVGDMQHSTHGKRAVFAYGNLARGKNRKFPEAQVKKVLTAASPSTYISKDVPPIMLVHGAADTVVHIASTDEFVMKMKSAGAPITYLRFADGHHGVMGQKGRTTTPAMQKFFKEHLQGPREK
jgi:acetyl esterase/lipase